MELVALLLSVCALGVGLAGVRVVADAERYVVIRHGEPGRVLGPGLCWTLARGDSLLRIELSRVLPAWDALSESDLRSELRRWAAVHAPIRS